jgi:hypothetical protein
MLANLDTLKQEISAALEMVIPNIQKHMWESARHLSCHERNACAALMTNFRVNLHFSILFSSICIMIKKIQPPKTQ